MKYLLIGLLTFVSFFSTAASNAPDIPDSETFGTVIFFGNNLYSNKQFQSLWYNKKTNQYFFQVNSGKKDDEYTFTEVFSVKPFKMTTPKGHQKGFKVIVDNDFQLTIFVDTDTQGKPYSAFITDGNLIVKLQPNNLIIKEIQ